MRSHFLRAAGRAAVQYVGASAVQSGSRSVTISPPGGTTVGDLLVAYVASNQTASNMWSSSGWTFELDSSSGGDFAIARKLRASGDSSYTFTCSASNSITTGAILVFRKGVFDVLGTPSVAFVNPVVAPSITPSAEGSIVVGVFGAWMASISPTVPSGMTQRVLDNDNTNPPSFLIATEPWGATATGTRSSTVGDLGNRLAVLLSIRPE